MFNPKVVAPPFKDNPDVLEALKTLEAFKQAAVQFYSSASALLEDGISDRDSVFAFTHAIVQATDVVTCASKIQKGLMRAEDLTALERRERGQRGEQELGRKHYLEAQVFYHPEEHTND